MDIQRRASIALRSLQEDEQRQIAKALEKIELAQLEDLNKDYKFEKLRNTSDENLYTYQGNRKLRLILSIKNNICVVEDILDRDKLDRLIANLKQQ